MEHSSVNSKSLEKQPDLSYGILIQNLPEELKTDAIKSLEESIGILPSSVVCVTLSKLGVNVVFDKYKPFYKAVTTRVLLVRCIMFKMYPMLTDLTIIGAAPYLTQNTIKSLMAEIAPVWSVYAEVDIQTGPTTNYRVIMQHPEIPDHIKLWPMCNFNMIGNNTSFPITFFCRLCRQNGHTRYHCNVSAQRSNEKILEIELSHERRKIEEEKQQLKEERQKLQEERRRYQEDIKIKNEKIKKETNFPNQPKNSKVVKTHLPNKAVRETSCKKIIFSKLIPPELRNTEKCLKELFFNIGKEFSSKILHDKAKKYPYGIDILLQHLNEVVQFNLREMSSRNSSERAHIIWIDSLYGKLKEEHFKFSFEEADGLYSNSGKSCTIVKEEPISYNESNYIDSYNLKSDEVDPCVSESARQNPKIENLERVIKNIKVDKDRCHVKKVAHNKNSNKSPNLEIAEEDEPRNQIANLDIEVDKTIKAFMDGYIVGKDISQDKLKVGDQMREKCYLNRKFSSERTDLHKSSKETFKKKMHTTKNGVLIRSTESDAQGVQSTSLTRSLSASVYVSCNPRERFYAENHHKMEKAKDVGSTCVVNDLNAVTKQDVEIREPIIRCNAKKDKIKCNLRQIKLTSDRTELHKSQNNKNFKRKKMHTTKNGALIGTTESGAQVGRKIRVNQRFSEKNFRTDHSSNVHFYVDKTRNEKSTCVDNNVLNAVTKMDTQKEQKRDTAQSQVDEKCIQDLINTNHAKKVCKNHYSKYAEITENEIFNHHPININHAKKVCDNHGTKTAKKSTVKTITNFVHVGNYNNDVKHHNQDEKDVISTPETLHQELKTDVKDRKRKDFSSTITTPKPRTKEQIASRKTYEKFSPGLSAAIRCSKGVLKPSELKAFLLHVRGKRHVWKMAKNYTLNVHGLIEQLQVIVHKRYQALKVNSANNREISRINELVERLKGHANCESCNT